MLDHAQITWKRKMTEKFVILSFVWVLFLVAVIESSLWVYRMNKEDEYAKHMIQVMRRQFESEHPKASKDDADDFLGLFLRMADGDKR